jgi:peroxiredoxin
MDKTMNVQARVWLVVICMMMAVGVVYALSTSTPSGQKVEENPVASAPVQTSQKPAETQSADNTIAAEPVSLSPDLSRTDAYAFLDPLPVGKKAPDFAARTAEGKAIKLSDFKGKKNLVLVFYQGSFCSVCGTQLTNIQSHLSDFRDQSAEIIAISADDAQHAMRSVGEHGLTFNVLPDPKKEIIRKFGIGNISKQGIAWPSLFIVDKNGVVKFSYASREGHRLHSNEILPQLSKITGKPAPKLTYDN